MFLFNEGVGEKAGRGPAVSGKIADHRLRAVTVHFRMLFNEVRPGNHIVVEEEDHITEGLRGPAVPGRSSTPVRLLDHFHGDGAIHFLESIGSPVCGSVDDDDDLDGPVILLSRHRSHGVADELAPLVGGNHHGKRRDIGSLDERLCSAMRWNFVELRGQALAPFG